MENNKLFLSILCSIAIVTNGLDIAQVNNVEKVQQKVAPKKSPDPEKPKEQTFELFGQTDFFLPQEVEFGAASLSDMSYTWPYFGGYGYRDSKGQKPKVLVSLPTTERPDFSNEPATTMPPLTPQQQQYVILLNFLEGRPGSGPQQTIPSGLTIPNL